MGSEIIQPVRKAHFRFLVVWDPDQRAYQARTVFYQYQEEGEPVFISAPGWRGAIRARASRLMDISVKTERVSVEVCEGIRLEHWLTPAFEEKVDQFMPVAVLTWYDQVLSEIRDLGETAVREDARFQDCYKGYAVKVKQVVSKALDRRAMTECHAAILLDRVAGAMYDRNFSPAWRLLRIALLDIQTYSPQLLNGARRSLAAIDGLAKRLWPTVRYDDCPVPPGSNLHSWLRSAVA